jgi:hypothetical protein
MALWEMGLWTIRLLSCAYLGIQPGMLVLSRVEQGGNGERREVRQGEVRVHDVSVHHHCLQRSLNLCPV